MRACAPTGSARTTGRARAQPRARDANTGPDRYPYARTTCHTDPDASSTNRNPCFY